MATGAGSPPALLVSACLLGVPCTHRGTSNMVPAVIALATEYHLVPVCPETMGGLPTPRPAAEVAADGRVRTAGGADVSDAYRRGAEAVVAVAQATQAVGAVLKARSPSCGCLQLYDGTFTKTLRSGAGLTAQALRAAGVDVRSEEDLETNDGHPQAQGDR